MNHRCLRLLAGLAALLVSTMAFAEPTSSRGTGAGTLVRLNAAQVANLFGGVTAPQGGGIVRVDESSFQAGSGNITFSELPVGSTNPVYTPGDYGGNAANPTVSFAGFFQGQRLGGAAECPPGAALTGCVVDAASAPLTLDAASPSTRIVTDSANPTSPVLSGSPQFNGPIAILFDSDQAAVGLDGGFFDNPNSTAITAFARDGTILGSVQNVGTGIEFLGLITADGSDRIAGLLFSLVGEESAGFAIDNVRFGTAGQVGPPGGGQGVGPVLEVPSLNDAGLMLMVLALASVALFALRR